MPYAEILLQQLEFYRDLGIRELYRRSRTTTAPQITEQDSSDSLLQILDDIGDCRRCR
ncbi:MAG: uracil-DNA glycosylase, partial [Acidobacteriia bacterium]|nr:uracil-DNA glycosylase [Terriglobia bacterium]